MPKSRSLPENMAKTKTMLPGEPYSTKSTFIL